MNNEPILILADKKGKAYEFANQVYKKLNSNEKRRQRYELGHIEIIKFADGEICAEIKNNVRKKTCYYIHDSTMEPQDWAMSMAVINDALMRSAAGRITNVLPYMKYARQDRRANPRNPITSSVFAKMIQEYAQEVITTDVHNPAIEGAFRIPFNNLKAFPVIINYLKNNHPDFLKDAVLVAPDIGSTINTESYAKRLGLPIAIANKKRVEANKVEKMTLVGDVSGKNAILVDDMIDTGGTLRKAAEIIRENGGKQIYACATHGLFTGNSRELFEKSALEKIIVTDSIPQESTGKIEVISLADLFSDAIFRTSHGESISEMYNR